MKKNFLYLCSLAVLALMLMSNNSGISNRNGAPGETTCNTSGCHTGNAVNDPNGSVVITDNIPATGYIPGQTYTINVTVSRNGVSKFGFGFEAVTSSNTTAGTLIVTNSTSTQLMSGLRTNMVHKLNSGLAANSKTFTFNWTAPAVPAGNITFYAAGNATNGNNNTTGDYIYTTTKVFGPHPVITGIVSGSPFCGGSSGISIPFVASSSFSSGNIFTAEISDASGSFAGATTIGTLAGTSSGTIISSLPLPSIAGTGYRIRVNSSNPAATGLDNGTNLAINTPPTPANAGANQNICGTSATLNANIPAAGNGTWSVISGSANFTNPGTGTTVVTGLGNGPNVLRWTISSPGCSNSISNVTVTSFGAPTPANASNDQTVCASFVTLNGNTPVNGTGTWTLVSGSGSITSAPSPTTTVTGLATGTNIFAWGIANGPCNLSTDTVRIIYSGNITVANAGTDQTVCASQATLSGNPALVGNGQWSVISGSGSLAAASNPASVVSNLGNGNNVFRWTITNGPCTPTTDDVVIRSVTVSPALAGPSQTVCTAGTTISAVVPANGDGLWSVLQGSAGISSATAAAITVSSLSPGMNQFLWTVSNAPCSSNTVLVTIVQSGSMSPAQAGADQSVCSSSVTLSAIPVSTGSGNWSLISGSGIIGSGSAPLTIVSGLGYGSNIFRWTVSSGTCAPSMDDVVITGYTVSTANAGNNFTVCTPPYPNLSANTPAFGTGQWSVLSGSGTFANPASGNSSFSNAGPNTNVYRWSISNGPCPVSVSDVIVGNCLSITLSSLSAGPYCPSTSMSLPVSFTTANIFPGFFMAQLSDINGNFPQSGAGVVTIGAGSNTPVFATIPSTTQAGSNYRIRIVHSSPFVESSTSGTISINTCTPDYVSLSPPDYTLSCTQGNPFSFTVTGNVLPPYVAELSNQNGVFVQPQTLGYSYFSPVQVFLPRGLLAGNYRLRLRSAATGILSNEVAVQVPDCSTTGITDPVSSTNLLLYPSPTHGLFYLQVPDESGAVQVLIEDLRGQLILEKNLELENGRALQMDISGYTAQMYIVTLRTRTHVYRAALIKAE